MSNKLTIVLSGKKSSGKSSVCKHIYAEYVNSKIGKKRFVVDKVGKDVLVLDTFNNNTSVVLDTPNETAKKLSEAYSIKMYSFADPLKQFLINVLGLDEYQCYGTDDDKNSLTHISWSEMPDNIKKAYSKPNKGRGRRKMPTGFMSARELMQVFGTDICRKMDENCWARGLYNIIKKEGYDLALIADARFPNEVTIGSEIGAKSVRLLRTILKDQHKSEVALDDFPLGEYTLVYDNSEMSLKDSFKHITPHVEKWLNNAKLI